MGTCYPRPYIDEQTWIELHQEIAKEGFEEDPFLREKSELPVCGLNLAFGWPLPACLKDPYERLAKKLSALGPGLYVYLNVAKNLMLFNS